MLRIEAVSKSYPGAERPALREVTLALAAGRTLALTGESGSGKSTLLHLAGALDSPDSGEIHVGPARLGGLDDAGRARLRREVLAIAERILGEAENLRRACADFTAASPVRLACTAASYSCLLMASASTSGL